MLEERAAQDHPAMDGDGLPPARAPEDPLYLALGIARLSAAAWWRTAGWTLDSSVRVTRRLLRAAASGESPAELVDDARAVVRDQGRRLLGLPEPGDGPDGGAAVPAPLPELEPHPSAEALRARGAELLARSADLDWDAETHPAFARILTQIAPDEARILRLLSARGPQPALDVRTWRPFDLGSQTIAPGISMIGANAGCLRPDRVHAYLSNLFRLGLIWFGREPVGDLGAYQVLEAQPETLDAMRRAGRARIIRRGVALTTFGEDFCRTCLPVDDREPEDAVVVDPPEAGGG